MQTTRIFRLLMVALSFIATQGTWLDHNNRMPNGQVAGVAEKRQLPLPTVVDPTGNTSSSSSRTPTQSGSDTSPTGGPTSSRTSRPTTTSASPTDGPSESTSTPEPTVETQTTIITTTNDKGEPTSFTQESTTTKTPGLSPSTSGGSPGMSKETRNTVIGVVVGVGGAIVLAALGFVAWRIWGRKKNAEENETLMSYSGTYSGVEKSDAGGSAGTNTNRNPFQQTLESYHAPTQVNASSNF